ncbi:TraR/DksA family transcriptional regulator [Aporhodopirellula aestuarii]|uniref:TraR/DksA C4-type zinc finger protein n=1 Tax=Aporhodopirellula aestuarii TaxID=2950107 RepID=A0ABT0U0E5_9BACT|nr:TraR/DksA family transcriptional regulator [Aporhodopirellula aestuarii]MCM2370310.1 TraR/DksA C4-type zinc finger protein [Aporhodopirellula aestuarii]
MTRVQFIQSLTSQLERRGEQTRGSLRVEMDELQSLHDQSVGDFGDRGIEAHASELVGKLAESESRELAEIEDALQRLHDGHFGDCLDCGKPIPVNRLRAIPHAARCIRCQETLESGRLLAA